METFNLELGEDSKIYLRLTFNNEEDLSETLSKYLGCKVTRLGEENFWVSTRILDDPEFPKWGGKWVRELVTYEAKRRLFLFFLSYINHIYLQPV